MEESKAVSYTEKKQVDFGILSDFEWTKKKSYRFGWIRGDTFDLIRFEKKLGFVV